MEAGETNGRKRGSASQAQGRRAAEAYRAPLAASPKMILAADFLSRPSQKEFRDKAGGQERKARVYLSDCALPRGEQPDSGE